MEEHEWTVDRRGGASFGTAAIDDQHQGLNTLAHELTHAIAEGRREDTQRLMNQLLGDARSHFSHEERLLLQAAYPRLAGHAALHYQITWEMEHAIDEVSRTASNAIRAEYGLLVEQLITEHTSQETPAFENFLRSNPISN